MQIKILNTQEDAIMSKVDSKWINPQKRLYDRLIEAENAAETLREVYLIAPDDVSAQSDYPPYERSGCKYPHHVLNENGDLVLSEDGIRAAYRRIYSIMGINITEEIREHIVRHYMELGIYTGSDFQIAADIKKSFNGTVNYSVDTLKEEIKKAMDSGYKPPEQPYCQLREYFITDPVVFYQAKTGIELIHPYSYWRLSEINDVWNNWLLMTDEMKKLSDEHSYRLFGKDNVTHYIELLKTHYDESVSSLSKQIKHYEAKILYYETKIQHYEPNAIGCPNPFSSNPFMEKDVMHDAAINFPDPNFEAEVREIINKPDEEITRGDVAWVIKLDICDKDITDLSGIEHFTALTELMCKNNELNLRELSEKHPTLTIVHSGNNDHFPPSVFRAGKCLEWWKYFILHKEL